jgi:hypothetical protein
MGMVAVFHLGGSWARKDYRGLSTALHAVGTVSTGAAIALVGQIFNIQEHWPAAILLWAVAALAGWVLLHDEAQQTLTLLLFPAWIFCELSYANLGPVGHIVYQGRFLLVWGVLYLTFFLKSRHSAVKGILFAVATVASVIAVLMMLDGWRISGESLFTVQVWTRTWSWGVIAALPMAIALLRAKSSFVPVIVSAGFAIVFPWCVGFRGQPSLAAHMLVAFFCIFLIWWGVRLASRALVNLGIVGFAIAVGWFYFSDIYGAMGRSLGLIGLGVLFLAGGWALEKMRRGLLAGMGHKDEEAL